MTEGEIGDFIAKDDKWFDSKGHAWVLYGICRAYARKFGAIKALEIGTRTGSTAVPMLAGLLAGNKDSRLISLDNNTDLDRDALSVAKATMEGLGLSSSWELYEVNSVMWVSPYPEYHVIYIDGDHSYDGVKRDVDKYSPMLAKHGIIGLHDSENHPDIRKYLAAHLLEDREWLTTILPYYNGMALARRRADWKEMFPYEEDEIW